MPVPLLCRLGLRKWRYYGEKVLIVWKEPKSQKIMLIITRKLDLFISEVASAFSP